MNPIPPPTTLEASSSPIKFPLQARVNYLGNALNYLPGTLTLTDTSLTFVGDNNNGTINLPLSMLQDGQQNLTTLTVKLNGASYSFAFENPEVQNKRMGTALAYGAIGGVVGPAISTFKFRGIAQAEMASDIGQFIAAMKATGIPTLQFQGFTKSFTGKTILKSQKIGLIIGGTICLVLILLVIIALIAQHSNA